MDPKKYTLRPYVLTVLEIMEPSLEAEPWEMEGVFDFNLTQEQARELIERITRQTKKQAGFVKVKMRVRMK